MIGQKAPEEEAQLDAKLVGLGLLNMSIAAQIGGLLQIKADAADIMNMLIEHTAKLLSLVEPEQHRNAILADIRRNLPGVLNRHVEARNTTPGGIYVPPAGTEVRH